MSGCTWEDLTGQVLQGRYTLHSLVSASSFRAEFVAYAAPAVEESEALSVTLIIPDEADLERQLVQIGIARRLAHPNLLRIVDGGECALKGTRLLFVVAEAAGATLAQVIAEAPLDLTNAAALIKDLLAGLDYIHGQGFVCRSLEPHTVVRPGGHWKLADLSQLHPPGPFEESAAAGPNTPPEAAVGSIEPGWDVWALGVTLRASLAEEVRRRSVFDAIIAGCLEPDPAKRLSPGEIRCLLDREEPAPAVVRPKAPSDGEGRSRRRSRVAVAAIVFAALLLVAVFAGVALRQEPMAGPAKATSVAVSDRAVSPPVGRPSPFPDEIETETKRSPAPQMQSPRSSTVPYPTPQPALQAESESQSASLEVGERNVGRANFFADNLNGRRTANGELFSNAGMTAAHPSFPFGTHLRVTNLKNEKSVVVRVNDRAPLRQGVIITVTRAAAEQLGFVRAGMARVRIEPVR